MNLNISNLLQLEQNCRNAKNYDELKYIIVNETKRVLEYKQAFLFIESGKNSLKIDAINDLSSIEKSSVYIQSIEGITTKFYKKSRDINKVQKLDFNDIDSYDKKNIEEIGYLNSLMIPLVLHKDDASVNYYLLLLKDSEFIYKEKEIARHLSKSLSYFLYATRKCNIKSKISFRGYYKYIVVLLVLCMFIPVKLSVLAPLEVIAKDAFIVTSPLKGAVKEIKVKPNEYIKKGSKVLQLDETDYKNSYILAKKDLQIIEARLKTAQQGSFYNSDYKANIDELKAQVQLAKSKLDFTKQQLDKTSVVARKSGVAILNNPSSWEGKPVIAGEKIFSIANKKEVQVEISLLVADALFLTSGAKIKAFLDNDPLNSWAATIKHISYEPELTSKNQLVYKITASFDDLNQNDTIPTIGLRGSAKIYSKEVSLFFYLFRKPITKLREYIGW
ncbi:MAG: efflux RND transporter periplasmic adaptor subunit [Campylobacterota bacterium]